MYSCKNDVCGVTLSLYPDRESSKMPDHGGNRTYYFKNASQAQCSANGVIMARSVCVRDVPKLKAETDRVRFDSATRIFDFQRLLTLTFSIFLQTPEGLQQFYLYLTKFLSVDGFICF